jgi:perosamine synthetase
VITTPFSFVASANCLLFEGATPVFCDVDPVTLNLDPSAARAAVTDRTAGVLPVDILGYPAPLSEAAALATEAGLGVLEDACEALGAVDSEGFRIGARGNLATFGFYANKQLTTGEGGMLVPSSPEIAARLRSERNQGRSADMGWLSHERLGYNYRLTDLQAAVGVAQLERFDERLAQRDRVAAQYGEQLGAIGAPAGEGDPDGLVLPCRDRPPERRSWFIYPILLPAAAERPAVIDELGRRGVEAKAYMPCIHLLPDYRERFGFGEGQFPVAEQASARLVALPLFAGMTDEQVSRVASALSAGLTQTVAG